MERQNLVCSSKLNQKLLAAYRSGENPLPELRKLTNIPVTFRYSDQAEWLTTSDRFEVVLDRNISSVECNFIKGTGTPMTLLVYKNSEGKIFKIEKEVEYDKLDNILQVLQKEKLTPVFRPEQDKYFLKMLVEGAFDVVTSLEDGFEIDRGKYRTPFTLKTLWDSDVAFEEIVKKIKNISLHRKNEMVLKQGDTYYPLKADSMCKVIGHDWVSEVGGFSHERGHWNHSRCRRCNAYTRDYDHGDFGDMYVAQAEKDEEIE